MNSIYSFFPRVKSLTLTIISILSLMLFAMPEVSLAQLGCPPDVSNFDFEAPEVLTEIF